MKLNEWWLLRSWLLLIIIAMEDGGDPDKYLRVIFNLPQKENIAHKE